MEEAEAEVEVEVEVVGLRLVRVLAARGKPQRDEKKTTRVFFVRLQACQDACPRRTHKSDTLLLRVSRVPDIQTDRLSTLVAVSPLCPWRQGVPEGRERIEAEGGRLYHLPIQRLHTFQAC